MNIEVHIAAKVARRDIAGLSVCDVAWCEAFAMLGELAQMPVGQTNLSFLTAPVVSRALREAESRERLSRHLILPSDSGVDLAVRLFGGGGFATQFPPARLVEGLMTFLDRSVRIRLAASGAGAAGLEAARARLAAHAPWHDVRALSAADHDGAPVNILLVDADGLSPEDAAEPHAGSARLVIIADGLFSDLAGMVIPPGDPARARPARSRLDRFLRAAAERPLSLARRIAGWPALVVALARQARNGSKSAAKSGQTPPANSQPQSPQG